MSESQHLLADYAASGSEEAFQELVSRYIDLVYSAAVRLVNGDTHLAEDVCQTVFTDLARMSRSLSPKVMLGGWLHRHTWYVATNTMRGERRRQLRERQAVEMNEQTDSSAESLDAIAPILDDAINQLGTADRTAIVLRYFEQQDFRTVGEKLGSNEEAARKRVNRALEKLHSLLSKRGVALTTAALATALGSQAVSAAPAGLAAAVSGAAITAATVGGTTTTISVLKIIHILNMTKLKMGIIGAIVALGIAIPLVHQHQASEKLRADNESLRLKAARVEELAAENARLAKMASNQSRPATNAGPSTELLKLRGEVGMLRQENAKNAATPKPDGDSMLAGLTKDAQMKKVVREQQKAAMTAVYDSFAKKAKLSKEQTGKLNDLMADNIMENIEHITTVLRENKSPEEREQLFAQQDAAFTQKLSDLLGPENFPAYQEYTRNMLSYLTSEQIKAQLSGDTAAKEAKAAQIYKVMQTETAAALNRAGLDPNFQTTPMLNFRNIASETEAEKNLGLLNGIYESAASQASSFLSPEELQKFKEFQASAVNASKMALVMNRKMMAPGVK